MTTVQFRQATQAADQILKADKAKEKEKLQWAKMPIADMPNDIQALAANAIEAEIFARAAMATLQAALDDKVIAPSGKRLVVTLGRQVSASTDSVLVAWAPQAASGTRVISFDQFIKG